MGAEKVQNRPQFSVEIVFEPNFWSFFNLLLNICFRFQTDEEYL